jgi:hypothetical protein
LRSGETYHCPSLEKAIREFDEFERRFFGLARKLFPAAMQMCDCWPASITCPTASWDVMRELLHFRPDEIDDFTAVATGESDCSCDRRRCVGLIILRALLSSFPRCQNT